MQLAHEVATSRYLFGRDDALSFHQFPRRVFKTTWDINVYNARASQLGKSLYAPLSFDPRVGYDPERGGEAPYPLLPDTPERREYFLNGPAPDSASTGTAMSSGIKTDSNNIAWLSGDPEDGAIETAPATLRRLYGMSTGLVTTGPVSHATPATFFAHNVSRGNYYPIGAEILNETRPDVVIGGGTSSYLDAGDVERARTQGGWVVVEREAGVDGATSVLAGALRAAREHKRLLALFGGSAGNFESPVPSAQPGAPSVSRGSTENPRLADATLAALEVLSHNPAGFFLMVEQADIDWANHANDFARMIGCVWDLHTAIEALVAFVDRSGDDIDWDNTTVMVTADHANSYLRLHRALGPGELPNQDGSSYPDGSVTYGSGGHTSELVTLYARGREADSLERLATPYPGLPIVDDTAMYQITMAAARR
jgi:alkaline phosphatase